MLHAVIMAGGTGTRFWPLSRAAGPSNCWIWSAGRTMIQATVDRLGELVAAGADLDHHQPQPCASRYVANCRS